MQTEGSAVQLAGAGTSHPSFAAPVVDAGGADLAFLLTVHDVTGASASATHRVSVHPPRPAPTSSIGKVHAAMMTGELDRETAIEYLALSLQDPALVPAAWRGGPEDSGTWAYRILVKEYGQLSAPLQAKVRQVLLPPGHPEGLPRMSTAGAAGGMGALAAPVQLSVEGAHVTVWYWSDLANGALTAARLVTEADTVIWPRMQSVWTEAHMPIVDPAGVGAAWRGTPNRLNIFLGGTANNGDEIPYGDPTPSASYIKLNATLPLVGHEGVPGLVDTAAHEMTHSAQDSFKQAEPYPGHRFIYDGVATWATDDVYPTVNSEHRRAPELMDAMDLPLEDDTGAHPYGGYLFFQWAVHGTDGRAFVRKVFENFESSPTLDAVENAFPSYAGVRFGLEYNWPSFLEALWNPEPDGPFWSNDALHRRVAATQSSALVLGEASDAAFEMDPRLRHLTGAYYHFTISDPSVRTIHFYDGLSNKLAFETASDGSILLTTADPPATLEERKGAASRVMVKRNGAWTSLGPASSGAIGNVAFCQDSPGTDDWSAIQEVVVIFGDTLPKKGHRKEPLGERPRLWATNLGCERWQGSASARTTSNGGSVVETVTATNLIWTRYRPGGIDTGELLFQLMGGLVSWRIEGTDSAGCQYSGADAWSQGPGPYGPSGILAFEPRITAGGAYRTITASATSQGIDKKVSYTVTCSTGSTTHETYVDWLDTPEDADRSISLDGRSASGSGSRGTASWTWDFQSVPGAGAAGP